MEGNGTQVFNEKLFEAEREFSKALRAAQADAGRGPKQDATFSADGRNTGKEFSFEYSSAQLVTEYCRGLLNKNGLTLSRSGRSRIEVAGNGLVTIESGFRLAHVGGYSERFTVSYPIVVPHGGTLVRGTTNTGTTLMKQACMDVLCVRSDEKDENAHGDSGPAGGQAIIGLPGLPSAAPTLVPTAAPVGLPPLPLALPAASPAATASAPITATASPAVSSAASAAPPATSAAPTAAIPSSATAASATTTAPAPAPEVMAAFERAKVSLGKLPAEKRLPALLMVNEHLARQGLVALVAPNGNPIRALAPTDAPILNALSAEIEAKYAGNGGAPAASPSGSPAPASPAQASPAPSAPSSAPAGAESNAALDTGLRARVDKFFTDGRALRDKKGEEAGAFREKVNTFVGTKIIGDHFDPAQYTTTVINRLEAFLAQYA